ncbi:PREDICTED: protein NLP8 isoform X2 [Tarenaya hassleriana]|uniref:protein NLP8 isoform X2 n=1 Tax=Tarenaya hassleriana TaxID=28532 RepID=UPI00053C9894|nr:PREDICTED: protein NLP8 isoform X2 [Tarenaya hassleriana]
MEKSFASKRKEIDYSDSQEELNDGLAGIDLSISNFDSENTLSPTSEFMNLESFGGWSDSPSVFNQYEPPTSRSMLSGSSAAPFPDPPYAFCQEEGSYSGGEGSSMQHTVSHFDCSQDVSDADKPSSCQNYSSSYTSDHTIPMSVRHSLDEKMLKALCLFMETSGEGILAQIWSPMKMGDQFMLSTCNQSYLLDPKLSGYREASRKFTFSADAHQCSFPGLPGRVYISGLVEWTSNVIYYKTAEYLRMKYAIDNEVRGSIAIPILEDTGKSCAVLELVTTREKRNFTLELESVCRALQAVDLRTSTVPRIQSLSGNQREALAEIGNVLRAVCHAHRLPLALTWIPCCYSKGACGELVKVYGSYSDGDCVLCVEDTYCYVYDTEMEGFMQACLEHDLREGEGVAGKVLVSNQAFFKSDVKTFDISEYPLVQHARKYGLNAAVAIKLRSTFTGHDVYVLELFLPVSMTGSLEQQLLLDNLSGTMQRICRTLRTALDTESVHKGATDVEIQDERRTSFPEMDISRGSFQTIPRDSNNFSSHGKIFSSISEPVMKKQSTSEKTVSLNVLQQHFSRSLKDAARSLGVCPTTLKRICRQHGITRWPYRKISKVNRSLRKMQSVIGSVQGVDTDFKYNPETGVFMATGHSIHESNAQNGGVAQEEDMAQAQDSDKNNAEKLQEVGSTSQTTPGSFHEADNVGNQPWSWVANQSGSDYDGCFTDKTRVEIEIEIAKQPFVPKSSKAPAITDDKARTFEPNQPISCSFSDSSNVAGGGAVNVRSSSTSVDDLNSLRAQNSSSSGGESGSTVVTVKATYNDDTVRFKIDPSVGCSQIYREVGKRFELNEETFQLKYLDDEEEWVMLVTDSDLHECLEILAGTGRHTVKFLVRDLPCPIGSSTGSIGYLGPCP